ncbi:hypothetical protein AgCh_017549 [Apium graveolens]
MEGILRDCHSTVYGGHYGGEKTAASILQVGFFWPTLFKDAHHASTVVAGNTCGGNAAANGDVLLLVLVLQAPSLTNVGSNATLNCKFMHCKSVNDFGELLILSSENFVLRSENLVFLAFTLTPERIEMRIQ